MQILLALEVAIAIGMNGVVVDLILLAALIVLLNRS